MILWGRLCAALSGPAKGAEALERGRTALALAERIGGTGALPALDRAITALQQARAAGAGVDAALLLSRALLGRAALLPPGAQGPLRARAIGMLKTELARPGMAAGSRRRHSLLVALAAAWQPPGVDGPPSPGDYNLLAHAQAAQTAALAACDPVADAVLWARTLLDLAALDAALLRHPLCPDPAARAGAVLAAARAARAVLVLPDHSGDIDRSVQMEEAMLLWRGENAAPPDAG